MEDIVLIEINGTTYMVDADKVRILQGKDIKDTKTSVEVLMREQSESLADLIYRAG